ncbi:MAG: hypothetical protein HWN69_10230 [Desulfobacterales bacterium]|nr:hypothetical protein [Desulfobacterales bacterium]
MWIYEGVTTWDFHTGVIESVGFFLFLLPGLILVSIGIPLIVTKKKDIQPQKIQPQKIQPQKTTVQTKLELAQKNLEKSRYIKAGRDFREVAQIYEIQKDFNAIIYYKRAAESYHASKNYGAFFNFLKKRVMRAKIELGAKVEILKDSANKLLQAGEPKRAADLVQKIRSLYQEEPLRDAEKAQYYDQLARQLEDGLIGEIEIDRRYRDL